MSESWKLCPSSELYLKRCIEAARLQTDENKWFKRFKKKQEIIIINLENSQEDEDDNDIVLPESDPKVTNGGTVETLYSKEDAEFFETIEVEVTAKFDFLVEECLKRPNLLPKLAENLSKNALEKFCNILFNKEDVNKLFLQLFYEQFFLVLLKRDLSWFSLDLLVKAEKFQPVMFKKLLYLLFKDIKMNNKVLLDFFQALSESDRLVFMNQILEIDFTAAEFEHNIFTVYTAYKNCKITQQIQSYVEKLVLNYSECLNSDKNFGKLLLAFLQEEKNFVQLESGKSYEKLEKVVENHKTAFNKPCLNVLKDVLRKNH